MENLIYLLEWQENLEPQRKSGSLYAIFPLPSPKGRIVPGISLYFLKPEITTAHIIDESVGLMPTQDPREI